MSCFHLSKGALGNKNGSWVLALLGWWKSIACLEVALQRGFARETLGEPSTFKLWQPGATQRFKVNQGGSINELTLARSRSTGETRIFQRMGSFS
jgi:hypothetical protein